MTKSESKYFNTAVLMDKALISILEKKDFQYISVKEICHKAGVNRSTFYLHYETIIDLLEETTEYINDQFLASFDRKPESFVKQIDGAPLDELVLINHEFLKPYLCFVKEHRSIFKAAFNNPDCLKVNLKFSQLKRYILQPIMDRFDIPRNEQKYRISYFITGIMAVIREWISGGCKESVEQIESIIIHCVRPDSSFQNKPL